MVRIIRILSFSVLALTAIQAPATVPGAYFRIVTPDGKQESYILGTDHGPVELNEFPGDVTKQISKAKSLLVERVMSPADLAAYSKDPISTLAKIAVFVGEPVDEATRQKLIEYGIPEGVAKLVSDRTCSVLGAISETQGKGLPLDLKITQAAYAAHVPVTALDTDAIRKAAEILTEKTEGPCSLKQLFKDNSVANLRQYFLNLATTDTANYRRGQLDSPDIVNGPLVVSRNLAWMPAIQKSLNAGHAFIAVGQDHLYGQNGVLSLLYRKGYSIQLVMPEVAPPPAHMAPVDVSS